MNKRNLILIILFLLLILIVAVSIIMFKKFRENKEEVELKTLYVKAADAVTNETVVTNFIVVVDNNTIKNGKTNLKGWEEVKIPFVKNIYLLNYGGEYYTNRFVYFNSPLNMELWRIGKLNVTMLRYNSTNIVLNLSVNDGQYRRIGFCVKWSMNFLDVYNDDFYILTNQPKRFNERYDRCYYINDGVFSDKEDKRSMIVNLKYKLIGKLNQYDEIEIVFFDSNRNYLNKLIVEDEKGEDVGGRDYFYIISSNFTISSAL